MHSRLKLLRFVCHMMNSRRLNVCTADVRCFFKGCSFLSNSFCSVVESFQVDDPPHVTESPELPGWLKSSSSEDTVGNINGDDDFVLPSLTNWIVDQRIHPPEVHLRRAENVPDNEVDQVSKILKHQFESPDAIVESLNSCSIEVTDDLARQILERFSFEWIPCLGFFKWAKSQRGFNFSPEFYDLMVDNLGKSRKFDLMFELVEEMKQLDGYITRVTMSKVLRRLSKAGKFDDAINAFRNLEQFGLCKDITFLNILLDGLIKNHGIELAESVYIQFKDIISPNASTFNILAHGFCIIRKLKNANKIVEQMKKHGFDPDAITCTSFIEAHCREKNFSKVEDMLKYMEKNGLAPSVITYTIIVTALGKAKEMSRALEFYEKMKQQGCASDSAFCGALIQALSKSGRWKDAREVFEDMAKQGINPDTATYNTMIAAAVKGSREEDALMLLKEMEERKCKPNVETYVPLLKMCCKLRRMKVLAFLLSHMFRNNISLNLGTYSLLVTGLCSSGKLDRACSFFEDSVKKGFVPMDSMYNNLMNRLEKKGMNKEKQRIEELMQLAKLHGSVDSSESFVRAQK